MKKLDGLGWAAEFAFSAFGVCMGVRVSSEEILDSIYHHLPFGWAPHKASRVERLYSIIGGGLTGRSSIRKFSLLYADVRPIARTLQLQDIYEIMESDMESYVAQQARRKLFVHAGAVSWEGRVIVIPGPSRSGKTTLVKALLEAGASYCSDEFAVFDRGGKVHPFPRLLSVREKDGHIAKRLRPENLGSQTNTKPLPLGIIILSTYMPGALWRPRALTPGRGALTLLANAPAARRQPEKALAILGNAASRARTFTGIRGEAAEVATSILSLLENSKSRRIAQGTSDGAVA
jgi:hypothetical protein